MLEALLGQLDGNMHRILLEVLCLQCDALALQ